MLPRLPCGANIRRQIQTGFGGLDRGPGAGDGALADMSNLTGDCYPLLASRPARYELPPLTKPNGLYAHGVLIAVDGDQLLLDGEAVGTVEDSPKSFCSIGGYVVILPDKVCLDVAEKTLLPMEASYTAAGLVFGDGEYAGQTAELNSITTAGEPFPFKVGDGVSITGATVASHNRTSVVREISEDGKTLRFYENVFAQEITEEGEVTLARQMPELDFLCENENRLWGCRGDEIFASKLGDPFNWNVFDGLSTDSYSVSVGSAGDFTACVSYLGYPVFFKEEQICKVYGSRPDNFQVMGSATLGVRAGCHGSLAVAGETLFYLSRAGVMAYAGGTPAPVSAALGPGNWKCGAAGSDGLKYYCSMEDAAGAWSLLVYDTQRRLWHREDDLQAVALAYCRGLYALRADGRLTLLGSPAHVPPGAVREQGPASMAEFTDFTWNTPDKKSPTRLLLRLEGEEGITLRVLVRYDGAAAWEEAASLTAQTKGSRYLAAPIRRCDHYRLRLEADGPWRLHSLGHEYYSGSAR